MECPKCGSERPPDAAECPQCGVIYEKWEAFLDKKQDKDKAKKYKKEQRKKQIILISVCVGVAIIMAASITLGPCNHIKPSFLMVHNIPATYSYDGQSIESEDHKDINKWLDGKNFGWYMGGRFTNDPVASIDDKYSKIYAQNDRVIIDQSFPGGKLYMKKCNGSVLKQMIINKIEKNQ